MLSGFSQYRKLLKNKHTFAYHLESNRPLTHSTARSQRIPILIFEQIKSIYWFMTIFHDYFSSLCVCFVSFFHFKSNQLGSNRIWCEPVQLSLLFSTRYENKPKSSFYENKKRNRSNKPIKMPTKIIAVWSVITPWILFVLFFVNSFYNLVLIYNTNANSQRISYTIDYITLAWCFYFNFQSLSVLR